MDDPIKYKMEASRIIGGCSSFFIFDSLSLCRTLEIRKEAICIEF